MSDMTLLDINSSTARDVNKTSRIELRDQVCTMHESLCKSTRSEKDQRRIDKNKFDSIFSHLILPYDNYRSKDMMDSIIFR